MHHLLHHISNLTSQQHALVALGVVALMVGIPYFGLVGRVLALLFRGQRKAIVNRFEWKGMDNGEGARSFYVEGSTAALCWEVQGAYRIDVLPIGRRLKGDAAEIVIKPGIDTFVLTAYGLSGKVQATLTMPTTLVKQLKVAPLGRGVAASAVPKKIEFGDYSPKTKRLHPGLVPARFVPDVLRRMEPRFSRLSRVSFVGSLISQYRFSTRKYQEIQQPEKPGL